MTLFGRAKSLLQKAFSKGAPSSLEAAKQNGLPLGVHAASAFLIDEHADEQAAKVREAVEARRNQIAAESSDPVDIYYSPKPGSADEQERPEPGNQLKFSRKRIAETGKDSKWGTFLHLLSRESKAERLLELGACAGLSALYLGSTGHARDLLTIEASPALAEIARTTLSPLGEIARVETGLFDDVLDKILPEEPKYDFVYIDGHHEKVATIHYFDRLREHLAEGAIVVFDDTNWSDDMRAGWDELRIREGFSHAIDYGAVGVCLWEGGSSQPKQWDLRALTGSYTIGKPHGWSYEEGQYVN